MEVSHNTNNHQCRDSSFLGCVNNLFQSWAPSPRETSRLSHISESPSNNTFLTESSQEFLESREAFESDDASTSSHDPASAPSSPRTSIPASPLTVMQPRSPAQQFFNASASPQREWHPSLTTRSSSVTSSASATCVVCMDQQKDIVLAPCQHSHCCLACFRRAQTHNCPMCRAPVRSVVLLANDMELPISLVMPKVINSRRNYLRASIALGEREYSETVVYERPRSLISRRSAPVMNSFLREEVSSTNSRTTSASSIGIARQAEYSVRPVPPSQEAALRRLRQTGTVQTTREHSSFRSQSVHRRNHAPTRESVTSRNCTVPNRTSRRELNRRYSENIVIIGHDRKLMILLVQKLIDAFSSPSTNGRQPPTLDKSTILVDGKAIRLVIIEANPAETRTHLALRVQRQAPKMVLMCADFHNVSSFESIVRLDMEVLDYLNVPCSWVLIKSLRVKRPRLSHSVENDDVRSAKHFISSRRRCFLITVDTVQESTTMRKLGYYLYGAAYKRSPSGDSGSLGEENHSSSFRRTWSFLCFGIDRTPRDDSSRSRIRLSSIGLGRWLR